MWRTLILMPLRVSFLPEGQREDSLEVWSKPKQVNRFLTERALPEEFLHQAVEALNPAILRRLNGLCSVRDEGQHWGVLSHTEIKNENGRRPGGEDKTQGSTGSTNGSLVCTFLHQTEELLRGAVVAVLLVQLFHCGQKLINDGLQLCAAYHLTTHTKIKRAQSLQTCWFYTFSPCALCYVWTWICCSSRSMMPSRMSHVTTWSSLPYFLISLVMERTISYDTTSLAHDMAWKQKSGGHSYYSAGLSDSSVCFWFK